MGSTKLEDEVALITGARSGIGRASALLFAAEGAKAVLADVVLRERPRARGRRRLGRDASLR